MSRDTSRAAKGSSPLTRGKRHDKRILRHHGRLIPAHAGKTRTRGRRPSRDTAHPRSRGENVIGSSRPRVRIGSSPLTRGKPGFLTIDEVRARLIPAHAGKTACPDFGTFLRPAHPRSRGENPIGRASPSCSCGSSPLTRGKLRPPTRESPPARLIPAHAGKTPRPHACPPAGQAHPRSRGENAGTRSAASCGRGSSPLTRGKPGRSPIQPRLDRLIPAHAGKTHCQPGVRCRAEAHPRSRGENAWFADAWSAFLGSSPLTRGKLGKCYQHRAP